MQTFLASQVHLLAIAAACLAVFFVSVFVLAWKKRTSPRPWSADLMVVLIAGSLSLSSVFIAYMANRGVSNLERDAYKVLKELPPKPIYADPFTKQKLGLYFASRESVPILDFTDVQLEQVRDAYLVNNRFLQRREDAIRDVFHGPTYSYPDIEAAASKNWQTIRTIYGGLLVIYYIP